MILVRVLVVEDDEDDAVIALRKLSRMTRITAEVRVAVSCQDAQRILKEWPADIVLLDMKLPNGSGLDVLRAMQRVPDVVPAVVLTGVVREQDKYAAMREGAKGYIDKNEATPEVLEEGILVAQAMHQGELALLAAHRRLSA